MTSESSLDSVSSQGTSFSGLMYPSPDPHTLLVQGVPLVNTAPCANTPGMATHYRYAAGQQPVHKLSLSEHQQLFDHGLLPSQPSEYRGVCVCVRVCVCVCVCVCVR